MPLLALPAPLPWPDAAAALQYGIERDFTNRTDHVILYDLGAASLQAALVTYSAYTGAKVGKGKRGCVKPCDGLLRCGLPTGLRDELRVACSPRQPWLTDFCVVAPVCRAPASASLMCGTWCGGRTWAASISSWVSNAGQTGLGGGPASMA